MMHPIQWPDIIIGVLLAEGFLYTLRSTIHFISRKQHNTHVMYAQRQAALDSYRSMQQGRTHEPLG